MSESKNKIEFSFDKFVKDIEKRETEQKLRQEKYIKDNKNSPKRKINKLYRERWQNRIKWNVKN